MNSRIFSQLLSRCLLAMVKFTLPYIIRFCLLLNKQFFFIYFDFLDSLQAQETKSCLFLFVIKLLLQVKALHFFFLYFAADYLSERGNILHFNFVALEVLPAYFNLFTAFCCLLASGAFNLMYVRNVGLSSSILRAILLPKKTSFFLQSRFHFGVFDRLSKQFFGYSLNQNVLTENIQPFSLIILNGCLWTVYLTDAVSLRIFFLPKYGPLTLTRILTVVIFQLNALFTFIIINLMYYILFLVATLEILVFTIGYIKLKQMDSFIARRLRVHRRTFPRASFTCFLFENELSLQYLADINRIYGNVFFAFTLLNTPFNAVFFMTLLLAGNQLTIPVYLFLVLHIGVQIISLLNITFFSILLSINLHRPARKLFALPAKSLATHWCLSFRLKLSRYLEQFHTVNLYTVNYGKFGGKITYTSTGRHLFLYIRLIIFAFKLVKGTFNK